MRDIESQRDRINVRKRLFHATDFYIDDSPLDVQVVTLSDCAHRQEHATRDTERDMTEIQRQRNELYTDTIQDLQTEVEVWKEKYYYLKEMAEKGEGDLIPLTKESEDLLELNNSIIELEAQVKKYKSKYDDAIILAEKSIEELKKTRG